MNKEWFPHKDDSHPQGIIEMKSHQERTLFCNLVPTNLYLDRNNTDSRAA